MDARLTREQVLALAPDASSSKAAGGLATDGKWGLLGADDEAVWGECQGSGAKPYQAQVDLSALVSRCSCPSRKFPCKHGLALLLLYAQGNPRFSPLPQSRPGWVDEWLRGRRERAARHVPAGEGAAAAPVVAPEAAAAAAAKREATRWKRITQGCAELERWIADTFRHGLANLGASQREDAMNMAARMVDAQAPALAGQLQLAMESEQVGMAGLSDMGERLGLLQLLNQAVHRRSALSPARVADLRAAVGWPLDKDEVLATGETLHDRWHVLGQCVVELPGRLTERRVWLHGLDSGRTALLQEFAHGGRGWERTWPANHVLAATLHFFPGTVPLRALAPAATTLADLPAVPLCDSSVGIDQASAYFATNPWLAQVPIRLQGRVQVTDDTWFLHTDAGSLPLQLDTDDGWALMAFAGGHSLCVMGEWDGRALLPLSAWSTHGQYWQRSAA